jgi:hypothetical protein
MRLTRQRIERRAMTERGETLDHILELELEMFLAVNGDEQASCQQRPDSFDTHRRAQFAAWSLPTLQAYLDDLRTAQSIGENLMTLKYALMDGLIPRENMNPLIDEMVSIGLAWQAQMFERYPALMRGARPLIGEDADDEATSFETYARGEYETYSDRTLGLLRADMETALAGGNNMSEEIYEVLVRESGYPSLVEAERLLAERQKAAEV